MEIQHIRAQVFRNLQQHYYVMNSYQFRQEYSEHLLVLNRYYNCYELLNLPAAIVFLMCTGENSLEQIFLRLREHFRVPEDILTEDLLELIGIFVNRNVCCKLTNSQFSIEPLIYQKAQIILETLMRDHSRHAYLPPGVLVMDY